MTVTVCRRRSKRTEEKAAARGKKKAGAPSDAGKRGQKCVIL
jgi:calmodulin